MLKNKKSPFPLPPHIKVMNSITTTIFPGKYIQGPGALTRLPQLIIQLCSGTSSSSSPRVFFTSTLGTFKRVIQPIIYPALSADKSLIAHEWEEFHGMSTHDEIKRLSEKAKASNATVIVGIGGGKLADVSKAVAHTVGAKVIVCPTIASTDAPCSSLSIVYSPAGEVIQVMELPKNPDAVVVDTSVVVGAPTRYLVAGMGDALATWFEAESCRQSSAPNCASKTDRGSITAYALAKLCFDTLREYGKFAVVSNNAHAVSPAFEHVVEANTLLSGVGFESAGLATAHSIHDGLTRLHQTHKYYYLFIRTKIIFLLNQKNKFYLFIFNFICSYNLYIIVIFMVKRLLLGHLHLFSSQINRPV